MLSYIWPVALIVLSNVSYHICAKSTSPNIDPFASLTVTYLIGAGISAILFYSFKQGASLIREYQRMNWATIALGIAIVGLEVGNIYAYKVGWQISTEAIVQSSFLAVALLFVGYFVFHEAITPNKLIGIVICLVGLYFINK